MSKPFIHAISSARRFGGKPEDYEEVHSFMDSSKSATPINTHRALTHNSWFISNILERIHFCNSCEMTQDNRFPYIINSQDIKVSIRDVGEQHILEDYSNKFIPTAQDFLENLNFQDWMQNGIKGKPSSYKNISL